jgi:hypothetical protein
LESIEIKGNRSVECFTIAVLDCCFWNLNFCINISTGVLSCFSDIFSDIGCMENIGVLEQLFKIVSA